MKTGSWLWVLGAACSLGGCIVGDESPTGMGDADDPFASGVAKLYDFEFDGELLARSSSNLAGKVRAQLLYTVGHFNAENSVSRLNAVELTKLKATWISGGFVRITYHAKLPVAWGSPSQPSDYTLTLPRRVDTGGQATFLETYGDSCTEHDGHGLTSTNVWYYYRPNTAGCELAAQDVTVSHATVTPSLLNTESKYPEYHRIWEDDVLDVVAVFGKNEKGSTATDDAGIAAYDNFVAAVREAFPDAATTPASLAVDPGVSAPDITFDIERDDGRVSIVVLLVDEVQSATAAFDARFSELTPRADLLLYSGHAGLGANVRALTSKARFFPAKYQLLFLNGCDTFAYEDNDLVAKRAVLNPTDPSGSKYMDVMRNAMPAYFHSLSSAAMAVINAAVDRAAPRTYEQIFAEIDPAQVVLVTGEEDNAFTPDLDTGARWAGLFESDSVGYKASVAYSTEVLPAGKYVFELTPAASFPGGDADLYLRAGAAPSTTATYKCASYRYNSNERCLVTLTQPASVFLKVVGDESSQPSPYELRAWQRLP